MDEHEAPTGVIEWVECPRCRGTTYAVVRGKGGALEIDLTRRCDDCGLRGQVPIARALEYEADTGKKNVLPSG